MDLYRTHTKYKFKLHRSMIMSVCLFAFGMIMEYGLSKDFNFINKFVFWIMIISILLNLFTDFILPKTAYNNLIVNKTNVGKFEINDNSLIFEYSEDKNEREWNYYDNCIETTTAFIIYKKDIFVLLMKKSLDEDVNEVRNLLIEKVNRGKNLIVKK